MDVFTVSFTLILSVAILQAVSPSVYTALIGQIIRFKGAEFGGRGLSILAPEPTDMGFTLFYMFVLISVLAVKSTDGRPYAVMKIGCFSFALLTLSGSSLFAFFFVLLAWLNFSVKKFTYSIFVTLLVFVLLNWGMSAIPEEMPRPFVMLHSFIGNPLALIGSTSLGYRATHFWIGFSSIVTSDYLIIGSGIGSLRELGGELLAKSGILDFVPFTQYYDEAMQRSVRGAQLVSSAGQLMLEMGVIGLLAIIFLIHWHHSLGARESRYIARLVTISFLLFIFQSFPLSYPLPWFVLGILCNRNLRVVPPRRLFYSQLSTSQVKSKLLLGRIND